MALTTNGFRVGAAGASDLADIREYIQNEQAAEAHRRRAEVKERTEKLVRDIASMMFDDEYKAWLDTTPNDNEGFLKACEVKYTELTTAPHPVDFTQRVEREIDEKLGKRMVVSATPVKVTVSRSWAERHLNVDINGFTAELDKAFGKGNWVLR